MAEDSVSGHQGVDFTHTRASRFSIKKSCCLSLMCDIVSVINNQLNTCAVIVMGGSNFFINA